MKVLITGHTHGIGKAILENTPSDYEVEGISRATGHDLTKNLPDVLGYIKETFIQACLNYLLLNMQILKEDYSLKIICIGLWIQKKFIGLTM